MNMAAWIMWRFFGSRQCLASVLCCLFMHASMAADAAPGGQRAQAVTQVVLGILSYARWPVEPAQLRLCIVGPTQYTDDLVKGPTQASGRPTTIASSCDAVYIGQLSADERSQLFATLVGRAVLSISEQGDPCIVGSLFCLRVTDDQVAFEVNLDSVARSGVRIHPSVLQLSRRRAAQP